MFVLVALNVAGVKKLWPYLLLGIALWLAVMQSGLHATLAGVMLAATIPLNEDKSASPLHKLEEFLHPVSSHFIMPVFALANAGLSFSGLHLADIFLPLPLGIMLGLFLGKQAGIFLAAKMANKLGWAQMPEGVTQRQFYGAACLAGVGFTMSLFIGTLAFHEAETQNLVRLGVISGSVLSAVVGLYLLRVRRTPQPSQSS